MSKWKETRLCQIAKFRRGISYSSTDYSDHHDGRPFITIKCLLKGGGYDPSGLKHYVGPFVKSDLLLPGDIVFAVTDLTRAGDIVGTPLIVPDFGEGNEALASMDLMLISPHAELCDTRFIYYRMMLADIRRQMIAYSAGSTVLHLATKKVPEFSVSLPCKNYQIKVSTWLALLDNQIEITEALIAKYQQIKDGLMHALFTRGVTEDGKLRPPRDQTPDLYKETPIGWLPKEWEVLTTKDLSDSRTGSMVIGPFGSNLVATDYREEGVPVVFVRDVKEHGFEWNSETYVSEIKANELRAHKVSPGDIVSTKMGLPPCVTCVYPASMPGGIITADIIRMSPNTKRVKTEWLSAALNVDRTRKQIAAITAGVTRPKVTLADFRKIRIATPSKEEQLRIETILYQTNTRLQKERAMLKKLRLQKSGLMHDLLTGKGQVKTDTEAKEPTHV